MLQSVFTNARERLEKDGLAGSPAGSDEEEQVEEAEGGEEEEDDEEGKLGL